MAKCINCNGSFLTRGKIKLKDAYICFKCADALGFDHKTLVMTGSLYSWDDIKDGADAYNQRRWKADAERDRQENAERLGLFFSDYGVLSDLGCSDNEMKAVERVCALLDDEGCDPSRIEYEREPDQPLTAFVGDNVLYQLKYTKDVKWIMINDEKHRISGPAGINKHVDRLVERYKSCL